MIEIKETSDREAESFRAGFEVGAMMCLESILENLDGFGAVAFKDSAYSRRILERIEANRRTREAMARE